MLVRYRQPWYLTSRVDNEFDRLISEAFTDSSSFSPAADVLTDGDDVLIKLAVAGVPAADIDVTLEGRSLVVTSERPAVELADGDRYLSRGLRTGAFRRTFTVAAGTTAEQVSASVDNGLLTVRIARAASPVASAKIAVVEGGAVEALDVDAA